MKVVCHLNPAQVFTDHQLQILADVGVDGHWLFSRIIDYIPEMGLTLDLPREEFVKQIWVADDAIREALSGDVLEKAEENGMDDDELIRLECYLEEYFPVLADGIERMLDQLFTLLRNIAPPPHCLKKDLLHYLWGYSLQGNHAGILHFDFDEQ